MEILKGGHARLRSAERGIALISVVWLLMILFAAATAMTMSGQTELWIARNDEAAAQAHAAAEAGANHALDVTVTYVEQWRTNGFANAGAAMSDLLLGPDGAADTADDGSLESRPTLPNGIPRPPTRQPLAGSATVSYEARVFDEDDPARGAALQSADRTRIGEQDPANATTDGNTRIVVRAIGYATADTVVRLEATIGPIMLPALVTDGSLTISGSVEIEGSQGSVHTNENLDFNGSPDVEQNATATGTITEPCEAYADGDCGGGRPEIDIPEVRASDYRSSADYILKSNGEIRDRNNNLLCGAGCSNKPNNWGWRFGGGGWDLQWDPQPGAVGTYYVETTGPNCTASVSGNHGPVAMSIVSECSLNIGGNNTFTPETPGILFVTDGDLEVTGSGSFGSAAAEGAILVHEQYRFNGGGIGILVYGQIIGEDAATAYSLVTSNRVSGNVTISYNGSLGGLAGFTVSAWREVR